MKNSERVKLEAISCREKFNNTENFLDSAIKYSTEKIMEILPRFVHKYPTACSKDGVYLQAKNGLDIMGTDWTQGFWTGMLWLSYELTGNELYRAAAEAEFDDYQKRYDDFECLYHHDMGFLYSPSIVAQYRITGIKKAQKLGLDIADLLSKRYCENAKIIHVRDLNQQGVFIIDCLMNLPLLFWASTQTGDRQYYFKALNHVYQAMNYMIRDDASTYAVYKIDEISGEPIEGSQGQGLNTESCWSRGQAWMIYGLALAYKYCKEPEVLKIAKCAANYYINRLPSDNICCWDLVFTADSDPRDSSAAAVAACGLLEISKYFSDDDAEKGFYKKAAENMLYSMHKNYSTKRTSADGLLLHGVYVKDKGDGGLGDDECCIWGDYFYLEGLMRLKNPDWNPYW